jgi:hypothetical protein
LLSGEFIAIASAAGISTPTSAAGLSRSDTEQIRSFVGFTTKPADDNANLIDQLTEINGTASSNQDAIAATNIIVTTHSSSLSSMNETVNSNTGAITIINEFLGTFSNFSTPTVAAELQIHESAISSINDTVSAIVNQSGKDRFIITGTPNTITSCTRNGDSYTLGEIVTQGDNSSNGILKTMLECTAWASNLKIDHYFTTTGLVGDCGVLIPSGLVYSSCMNASGISISLI